MSASAGATRRAVLLGAGAVGAVGVLAACGGGSDQPAAPGGAGTTPPGAGPTTAGPTSPAPTTAGTTTSQGGATTSPAQGESVPAADIPVGGGKIFADKTLVVTQPAQGQFKAFDATCTHQQCLVGSVDGGLITCPCHGSQYRIADGSVARGPAARALGGKTATVQGDQVVIS